MNLLTKIKTDFQVWLNKNSQDEHPLNFSFQNWLRVFISTLSKTQKDNISLLAAGIAFYFFFALLQRILLTLTIMLTIIAYLLIIIILPIILDNISASQFNESLIKLASWAFLLVSSFGLLGLLYKYAPDRHSAKWRWVSPGAFVAGILWLLGSYAFNMYVSHFGAYNETYGSVGGIIILLMWFYMTAFIVLIGAEINASSELHTSEDTTIGPNLPIGERGAFVADNTKTD